jgi:succinate dehydrogenase/fumarate reductase-like Fe-S protein
MARADSLARLALAYGVHQARRRLRRPRPQLAGLLETYAVDGIRAVEPDMRESHPRLVNCINCGLCALAAGRLGKTRLPDLASSYMRLYARLDEVSSDISGDGGGSAPDLAAAASVCPVGLPLDEVAAVVRRMMTR